MQFDYLHIASLVRVYMDHTRMRNLEMADALMLFAGFACRQDRVRRMRTGEDGPTVRHRGLTPAFWQLARITDEGFAAIMYRYWAILPTVNAFAEVHGVTRFQMSRLLSDAYGTLWERLEPDEETWTHAFVQSWLQSSCGSIIRFDQRADEYIRALLALRILRKVHRELLRLVVLSACPVLEDEARRLPLFRVLEDCAQLDEESTGVHRSQSCLLGEIAEFARRVLCVAEECQQLPVLPVELDERHDTHIPSSLRARDNA